MAKIKNKQELISKIKNAEGFSNEEKSQMLALLNESKTYGLVWEKSTEDAWEMMKDYVPVLKEDESKRIDHGSENPNHILIEGDNLNALTALSYTHEGKVDVIYIDPPYNTGKEDEFKYNDKFVDAEDSFRHSKWLSFMDRRLRIAKRLLKQTGLIFISIDDNELCQLKCLCDELFNTSNNPKQSNCLGVLVWDLGTGTQAGHFTRAHEYILVYTKNKDAINNFSGGEGTIDHSALKKISKKNPAIDFQFKAGTKFMAEDGIELTGSWGGSEKTEIVEGRMVAENNKLKYDVTLRAGFAMVNQMRTWFNGQNTIDSKGQHVTEFYFNSSGVLHYVKEKSIINPPTIIKEVGSTKVGTNELAAIFGNTDAFGYPKPLDLIKYLLKLHKEDSVIVDFFAGSGTTLHATMQLNAEDGGHRQCILVTNNENNICEEVTYERNKRVIEGYTKPNGEFVEGLKDNNLRYFKVGFTPREKTDENMFRLAKNSVNLLRIKHDVYKEKQFGVLENPYKRYRYFEEDGKQLLVILDTELIGDIVEQLEEMEVSKPIPTYVFTTGAYPFTEDFESVADKVELYPLPHCLYQACERNMPKMIDKEIENPEGISLSNEELETSMDDLTKEEA